MRKVTRKYKGWAIKQDIERSADGLEHIIYRCYTPEEWEYPSNIRLPEWDACSLQEAKDFIDTYNNPA